MTTIHLITFGIMTRVKHKLDKMVVNGCGQRKVQELCIIYYLMNLTGSLYSHVSMVQATIFLVSIFLGKRIKDNYIRFCEDGIAMATQFEA